MEEAFVADEEDEAEPFPGVSEAEDLSLDDDFPQRMDDDVAGNIN